MQKPNSMKTKKARLPSNLYKFVEVRGVEPLTSCMPCKRSSQLSYTPILVASTCFPIAIKKALSCKTLFKAFAKIYFFSNST